MDDVPMDPADLRCIARTLARCGFPHARCSAGDYDVLREGMLMSLATSDARGASDAGGDRAWSAGIIEVMGDDDVKRLFDILIRAHHYRARNG